MDDKSKKIIQRYVDGEKQLFSKLALIFETLEEKDDSSYASYLKALFNDNLQEMLLHKKQIFSDISRKGFKPNFDKKKSKFKK
jgi:hypothetical protein